MAKNHINISQSKSFPTHLHPSHIPKVFWPYCWNWQKENVTEDMSQWKQTVTTKNNLNLQILQSTWLYGHIVQGPWKRHQQVQGLEVRDSSASWKICFCQVPISVLPALSMCNMNMTIFFSVSYISPWPKSFFIPMYWLFKSTESNN